MNVRKIKNLLYNLAYRVKLYKFKENPYAIKNAVVLFFDSDRVHPGLVDRLKAIVCLYGIAKCNNRNFYIKLNDEFCLDKFLLPNKIDWRISNEQIEKSQFNVRIFSYNGIGRYPRFDNKCIKQYHCYNYRGLNIFQRNGVDNWEKKWHDLYIELFKPSDEILRMIEKSRYKKDQYIAVHVRFVNSLEIQEPDYPQKPLPNNERKILINSCLNVLSKISSKVDKPLLLFSDSQLFLDLAKERGYNALEGKIGHLTYNSSDIIFRKTVYDLYMISRAETVYRIKGDNLYNSAFVKYAALIGNKNIIEIDYKNM